MRSWSFEVTNQFSEEWSRVEVGCLPNLPCCYGIHPKILKFNFENILIPDCPPCAPASSSRGWGGGLRKRQCVRRRSLQKVPTHPPPAPAQGRLAHFKEGQVRRRRRGPCTCAWRGRWRPPPCHPCPSSAPLPWGCTLPPPPRPSEIGLRSLDWDLNTPWTWEFYFNLCQCLLQQWVLADRDRGLARSQIWCLVSAGLSYRYSTHLFSKIYFEFSFLKGLLNSTLEAIHFERHIVVELFPVWFADSLHKKCAFDYSLISSLPLHRHSHLWSNVVGKKWPIVQIHHHKWEQQSVCFASFISTFKYQRRNLRLA